MCYKKNTPATIHLLNTHKKTNGWFLMGFDDKTNMFYKTMNYELYNIKVQKGYKGLNTDYKHKY